MATPVIMPRQGNTVESCILVQWMKQVGDTVAEGEALCEIETDKSTFEVTAPAAGTLLDIFFPADADVPVLVNIAAIGNPGEDIAALRPEGSAPAAPAAVESKAAPTAAAAVALTQSPVAGAGVSPRARAAAAQAGVDAASLAGTGPQGRVIERDVLAVAGQGTVSPAARAAHAAGAGAVPATGSGIGGRVLSQDLGAAAPAVPAAVTPAPTTAARGHRDVPVKGVRKVVAERMRQSLSSTAQLTLFADAPASALQALRARMKAGGEAAGLPPITVNDLLLFAVSRVLPRHPRLNAHFLGQQIREFSAVHLGIAVDTERGLLVPVLRDADLLSLSDLSRSTKAIGAQAQAGGLTPDQLSGSTFTITNLGALGIGHFTPVLNVPEVAILGVGGIRPVAVQEGAEVVFRPHIALSLTIDHQAADGAPAARFLADLCQAIANIDLLIAR